MYFVFLFLTFTKIIFIMSTPKKKATTAGGNGAATIDIPHEEVKQPGTTASPVVVTEPQPDTDEARIKNEIAKFNVADGAIAQMKEVYGALVIKDENDKDGYNQVKKAWGEVRTKRTSLEKKGLELRNQFKVITTAISKEEDRLVTLITPLEEDLYGKWKKIDDAKEQAKKAQEEEEGRQLMARIEELQTLGMKFRDGFYQIGDTITADVATLRAMPADMFEKLKTAVKNKAAELQKIADDEAEKKRQAEAEQERQRQELKKQQDELAEQQRQLQAQKDEMAKQLRDMRLIKLQSLGMDLVGKDVLQWDAIRLYIAPLIDMTADEFNRTVDITAEQIKELKNKRAQEEEDRKKVAAEKDRRDKYIASCMETAGMTYNWAMKNFQFKLGDIYTEMGWKDFEGMDDAAIALKAQEVSEFVIKAKKDQETADKKKLEDQQKAAKLGLTDKTRWERDLAQLEAQGLRQIVPAEFKTPKYQNKAMLFMEAFKNIINEFK